METDTERGGGHVKMEGVMGVMGPGPPPGRPQTVGAPAAGKEIGSGFPSEPPEGANPPGTVTLDFWTPDQ